MDDRARAKVLGSDNEADAAGAVMNGEGFEAEEGVIGDSGIGMSGHPRPISGLSIRHLRPPWDCALWELREKGDNPAKGGNPGFGSLARLDIMKWMGGVVHQDRGPWTSSKSCQETGSSMNLISPEAYEAVRDGDLSKLDAELARDPEQARGRDASGLSLMMMAIYHRKPNIIKRLRRSLGSLTVFELAGMPDCWEQGVRLIRDNPALAHAWSVDGFSPLHLSAFFGNVAVARKLIDLGADVHAEARNGTGLRPVHSAAAAPSVEVLRMLLAAGADPNVRQRGGWTPLHTAAHHNHRAVLEVLIRNGADTSARADDGKTAHDLALAQGHHTAAVLIAAAGSSVGTPLPTGSRPDSPGKPTVASRKPQKSR
jgi:hypothetical protein